MVFGFVTVLVGLFLGGMKNVRLKDYTEAYNAGFAWVLILLGLMLLATRNAQVDRSDLVLYKVGGKEYLGRVIAKENDEVSYVDDVLYLNGQATPEPYLNKMLNKHLAAPTSNGYYTDDFFLSELKGTKAGRVPSDTYLVLNDNRGDTEDSREFGYIHKNQIEGVVNLRLYPLNKFGFIKVEE